MAREDERVAATALFAIPEWAVLDGRCATCRHAMARTRKITFRCDQHDVPIKLDNSCDNYAPAPSLIEARAQLASSGVPAS